MELLLILALALLLVALIYAWFYHMSEGGFWNFWMAFNAMDAAGKVMTLLITLIASMFNNDS